MRDYIKYKQTSRALNSKEKIGLGNCGKNICNCNYLLFTKLAWPGDCKGTLQSSSKAADYPPVYHTRRRIHTAPLIAERQARNM